MREEVRKQYIAYKLATNFVEVVPLATELKLYPRHRPSTSSTTRTDSPATSAAVGHWGTGSVEVRLADSTSSTT